MVTALTVHTERLHDDLVWRHVRRIADGLRRRGISATWFSINPAAPAYRPLGYDEALWRERLRYLADRGQHIEQHTHFYASAKGAYDFSSDAVRRRIREDRAWLSAAGHAVTGFVSGAWAISPAILAILADEGYAYDCSARTFPIPYLAGRECQMVIPAPFRSGSIVEIPTTSSLSRFWRPAVPLPYSLPYFHDYDLAHLPFRILFRALIASRPAASFALPSALI